MSNKTWRVTIIRRYERSYDIEAATSEQAEQLALEAPDDEVVMTEEQ